jgi:hypothetical protein
MSIIIHRPHPYQDAHPSNPSGLPRNQVRVAKARVFMGETAPSPLRSYQIVWMVRLRMLGLLDHLESWASLSLGSGMGSPWKLSLSLSGFRYGITLKVEPLFLGSGMGLPYPSVGSPWKLDLDMMPARRCDFLLCKKSDRIKKKSSPISFMAI